ncbi:MAG TPA: TIGR04282 family arsenosugar biosynthesis glycosyltransferase [Candidatus Krumholzibacteria bacterium]|nr:TIGR04282 family arsenosugar biosynthesis glycosyltransferase [Candidatus Krumholzibacteria bacterium]
MRSPVAGEVKTRLEPALTADEARDVYVAFMADFFARLRDSKYRPTVFLSGGRSAGLEAILDPKWSVVAQGDGDLGARLTAAFAVLLRNPGDRAVIVGSDSPDLPLAYLKKAFQSLKHRDVVIGPAIDGGYYLIGLRAPAPALFRDVHWGAANVLDETLDRVDDERLSLALLPPWYDVDDAASLRFLADLNRARRIARQEPLRHCERALAALFKG